MADVTKVMASRTNCSVVLDIGSGVGHLSRLLSVRHQFKVVCVDAQNDFISSAQKFDRDLKKILKNKDDTENIGNPPEHLTFHLDSDENCAKSLHDKVADISGAGQYGILGLHTCGDLGPTLIKLFANSAKNGAFLQSVGCCYMKMEELYPMSHFLKSQEWFELSYTARELSCHAIEMYSERLGEDKAKLKIHCYRAVLEHLLMAKDPNLRHLGLKTVPRAHEKTFCDYAKVATSNLNLEWVDEEFECESVISKLKEWWKVVLFYSFRLSFAPLIETVILLDRLVFLHEQGLKKVALLPIFDPIKSPRNHVLLSMK